MIATQPLTLEAFLQLPETEPASEYIAGEICQKSMLGSKPSRLRARLMQSINEVAEESKIAYAFPELRCTFSDRSIVPDVAVLRWEQIEFDANGEPVDDVTIAPDWLIEILSPEQSANRVAGKILHSLQHGCQLGWVLDTSDRSILVFLPDQLPALLTGDQSLPVPDGMTLRLTAEQVFDWLKMQPSST
jgi:Uma2 family endonuclease